MRKIYNESINRKGGGVMLDDLKKCIGKFYVTLGTHAVGKWSPDSTKTYTHAWQ